MINYRARTEPQLSRRKQTPAIRSSITLRMMAGATLLLATACSPKMQWQTLGDIKKPTPEEHNLALLTHIYQVQDSGRDSTREEILELSGSSGPESVASDTGLNEGCLHAFDNGNSRDRFICVMRGALAWHTDRHGSNASNMPLDLMIYFNGGLNTKNGVLKTAFDSYEHVKQDGYYPIYMPWPTGPFDTYIEDWLHVRAGRYTKTSEWTTLGSVPTRPFYDLLLGLASTPGAWSTSAVELTRSTLFKEESGFEVHGDTDLLPKSTNADEPLLVKADNNLYFNQTVDDEAEQSLLSSVKEQAIYLGLFPARMITTPAIGPGFALWRNMVRRSRTAFRDKAEFPGEDDVSIGDRDRINCWTSYEANVDERQTCHPGGSGAFGQFFHWLGACLDDTGDCPLDTKERNSLKTLRLTLIGHSMGTIVINEAIRAFPDLPYHDIVYMAGAATVRDTADALSPVLVSNHGCTRFYNLMLHPLNDSREETAGGALIYGSLLSYIDEYLENPKTLPDRTVGQWRNLRQTRHLFPPEARRWSLYRVFDRDAQHLTTFDNGKMVFDWNPTTHGSFNDENMPFWRESFRKPDGIAFDDTTSTCAWPEARRKT